MNLASCRPVLDISGLAAELRFSYRRAVPGVSATFREGCVLDRSSVLIVFRSSRIFVCLYVSETWTIEKPETPAAETRAATPPGIVHTSIQTLLRK